MSVLPRCIYVYHMPIWRLRRPEKAVDTLELGFAVFPCGCRETDNRSSVRAESVPNHRPISPAPTFKWAVLNAIISREWNWSLCCLTGKFSVRGYCVPVTAQSVLPSSSRLILSTGTEIETSLLDVKLGYNIMQSVMSVWSFRKQKWTCRKFLLSC